MRPNIDDFTQKSKSSRIKIKKVLKQQDSEGNEIYTLQNSSLLEDSFLLQDVSNVLTQYSDKTKRDSFNASAISTISAIENNLLPIRTEFSNLGNEDLPMAYNQEKLKIFRPSYNKEELNRYSSNENVNYRPLNEISNYLPSKANQISKNNKPEKSPNLLERTPFLTSFLQETSRKMNLDKNESSDNQKNVNKENSKKMNFMFQSEFPNGQNRAIPAVISKKALNLDEQNEMPVWEDNSGNKKMFRSQSQRSARSNVSAEEMKDMMLPKDVIKINEEKKINLEKYIHHINSQKIMINNEIDEVIHEITEIIEKKRKEYLDFFDNYLHLFKENYDHFQQKIKVYKENSFQILNNSSKPRDPFVYVHDLHYYLEGQKIKTETCPANFCLQAKKIRQDVRKKEIFFLSNEINKQLKHMPEFSCSETASWILKDSKQNIMNEIENFFENFQKLIYEKNPMPQFKTLSVIPKFSSIVLDDHLTILTNFNSTKNLSLEKIEGTMVDKSSEVNSFIILDSETVITGDKKGEVKQWVLQKDRLHFKETLFKNDLEITFLVKFEGNEDEIMGKSNFFKDFLTKNLNKIIKKTFILVFDREKAIVYDPFCRKHHTTKISTSLIQEISSIIPLHDNYSLIFGTKTGNISLWGIEDEKSIYNLKEHSGKVNCLLAMRDDEKFVSAGENDQNIIIWRVYYEFSLRQQRKIAKKFEKVAILINNSSILRLKQCFLDENILVSEDKNHVFKFWDVKRKKCREEKSSYEEKSAILVENLADGYTKSLVSRDNNFNGYAVKKGEIIYFVGIDKTCLGLYKLCSY